MISLDTGADAWCQRPRHLIQVNPTLVQIKRGNFVPATLAAHPYAWYYFKYVKSTRKENLDTYIS